ncbi:hypothetical protein [Spirosoma radiotolerans]|uniref:Uncharacterized protein n=1 Tax=Spirosoma radiotolerans TaxID=1379870 RepID=A0A0E4A132_9BACT|nr:hypothetical protein [Spirosoma radiotolerans]AKD58214.1 hypothetical protein SD10_28255 [Spirosoma radiotolerans]
MHCLLINYDGGSQSLLSQYVLRAGGQELSLATSPEGYTTEANWWLTCDFVFLHLTCPDENVRDELAAQLIHHPGVVITSPFPKHQFPNLFMQPFAFLTEPFSFKKFTDCIAAYQQEVHRKR